MDIQALMDAFSAASKSTRKNYHATLGSLIADLEAVPAETIVSLDVGGHPSDPHSYRGYYEDLAFEAEDGETTAAKLLEACRSVHGRTLEGYKGGDLLMDDEAVLWIASYGSSGGRAILGCDTRDGRMTIKTREVE